jgi:hypothetical protein
LRNWSMRQTANRWRSPVAQPASCAAGRSRPTQTNAATRMRHASRVALITLQRKQSAAGHATAWAVTSSMKCASTANASW